MSFLYRAVRPLSAISSRVVTFNSCRVGALALPRHVNSVNYEFQQQRNYAKKKAGKAEKKGKKGDDVEVGSDATAVSEFDISKVEAKFLDSVEALKREFNSMRVGRANPAILDTVVVAVNDGAFPLNQLAQVSVKDPQTLIVNVYDSESISAVDKAIRIAGLNLNPVIDNKIIRVPIPKLNKEFRENLIKMAGKTTEKAKMSVRNVRQDALKQVKKEKNNGVSEDDIKKLEKKVQTIVDKVTKDIEDILKAKSNEIMKS
ncbi:hypothetical protein K7432_015673 [Basidiobolus ranarum]|uniref:Ribosome recycling factor domain-containing protein n=1 Tax=Basidiobolus ranarum TaxID=34480 RepID=A0ABR2VMQ9_9FUNG